MKIIYIGDVRDGTTTLDRLRALERLGHTLIPFNVPPYQSRYRLISSIQSRLHPRFLLQKLNDDIKKFSDNIGTFDCVWIDKGVWIFAETVEFLQKKCGLAVHFTPDPQLLFHRSHHFIESIPIYDYVVTTKDFEIPLYAQAGAKNTIYATQSYCPGRYKNPQPSVLFLSDIGFIGRCEPHYLKQVNAMSMIGKVTIFGDQWFKRRNKKWIDPTFSVQKSVWKEDYVAALASFKIGLGLLSKIIPEQHTTRTFEIPAAGTFLLAERTIEHENFFTEGVEAEFFSSPEEMRSKAKFYLSNDVARQRIALQGQRRCKSSGYDTDSVMGKIIAQFGR